MKFLQVNKLGPCRGLVLLSLGRWTLEFWYIPPKYDVKRHKHDNIDVRILHVYGSAVVEKKSWKGTKTVSTEPWKNFLSLFRIRPSEYHAIWNFEKPLLLLVLEKWIGPSSKQKVSVSTDITYYG